MSYHLLPPVNHHQQVDRFSYHNRNDRLRLANQKPNTNYIISQESIWNVEIANLTAKYYTLLDVNSSGNTVYRLETLGIHLFSPFLGVCKVLGKY